MTEKQIYDRLTAAGLTPEGAAGLMGNLQAESGLNPQNLQNTFEKKLGMTDATYTAAVDSGSYGNFVNDGAGYGLAQWTYHTRKANLLKTARDKGVSIGDIEMQLAFLLTELAAYGDLWTLLRTTKDIDKASDMVLTRYERPADQGETTINRRRSNARAIFERCATQTGKSTPATEKAAVGANTDTDSPLVSVTDWTTKHSGKRTERISKITIHHMAGVMTAAACMKYHRTANVQASANYYIGNAGDIGQAVKEADRAWTSSSAWNDNRAVTIEVSNSKAAEPWDISDAAYKSLITLCADICKRNGIKPTYDGTKNATLTEHRMFSSTACPGTTLHKKLADGTIAADIFLAMEGITSKPTGGSFTVRVSISDLNIRKGPGTDYGKAGVCPPGVYTITETQNGKGSKAGWGKLKSNAGWISLDYAKRT